jgi:hypothetical protein
MKTHLFALVPFAAVAAVLPFANFEIASSLLFTAGFLTIFAGDYQSRRALRRVDRAAAVGAASMSARRTESPLGLAA